MPNSGDKHFADLEGLPEGLVDALEKRLSALEQSFSDKLTASLNKLQKSTGSQEVAKPSDIQPRADNQSTLDRIQELVTGGGLSFEEAREKAELEETMRFVQKLRSGEAALTGQSQPAKAADIDFSALGVDPNDPEVTALMSKREELGDLQFGLRLAGLTAQAATHKSAEPVAKEVDNVQPDELRGKIQSYVDEMDDAMALPSREKKPVMRSIQAKWREQGVPVDNIDLSV